MATTIVTVAEVNKAFHANLRKLYGDINVQISVQLECSFICKNPNILRVTAKKSELNQHVELMLSQNREQFNTHAKRVAEFSHPDVCWKLYTLLSVVRQLTAMVFDKNLDAKTQNQLKAYGTRLFYHAISRMKDQRSPQLHCERIAYKEVIEHLGRSLIHGNGEQVEPMYKTMCENQQFLGILLPYFSPISAQIEVVLRVYSDLIRPDGTNEKFWRLCLQQMDMEEIVQKFTTTEHSMEFYKATVHGYYRSFTCSFIDISQIYRSHSAIVAFFQFPRSFMSYFHHLLRVSATQQIPAELIENVCFKLTEPDSDLTVEISQQIMVTVTSVLEETKTRCKVCKDFGILHCWVRYCPALGNLLKTCFCVLLRSKKILHFEETQTILNMLRRVAAPFVEPINIEGLNNIKRPGWAEEDCELMDKVIFPWFHDCLAALIQDIEDDFKVKLMSSIWHYLTTILIDSSIKDSYMYKSYEMCFLKLPWQFFRPTSDSLNDLQQILSSSTVVQPLMTGIVVRVPWCDIIHNMELCSQGENSDVMRCFHVSLLSIVIHCASTKDNLKDCKASYPKMIDDLYVLKWDLVDFDHLSRVLQFFIDTFGVDSVFSFQDDVCRRVLRLLEKATEFVPLAQCQNPLELSNRLRRRRLFIEMLMKCLIFYCEIKNSSTDFAGRYFVEAIDRVEILLRMIADSRQKYEEAVLLLEPIVEVLNKIDSARYMATVKLCLFAWIDSHADADIIVYLVHCCGKYLKNLQTLLSLQEKFLEAYFTRGSPKPSWTEFTQFLLVSDNFMPNYVAECKENNYLMSLFGFFMQQLPRCAQLADETLILRDMMPLLLLFYQKQYQEPLILLFVGLAIELLVRQIRYGGSNATVLVVVKELIDRLQQLASDNRGSLLSVIGLAKSVTYTTRLKLCCHLLQAYLQRQVTADNLLRVSSDQSASTDGKNFVQSLKSNRHFSQFRGSVDLAADFLAQPQKTFLETHEFYSKLVVLMYNEKFLIDKCAL